MKTIILTNILGNDARAAWSPRLSTWLNMPPIRIEDVLLYRIPPELLGAYKTATAHEMAARAARIELSALIGAANSYLNKGLPIERLSPWEAARHGVLALPQAGVGENPADPWWWQNLWLGPYAGSSVGVGIIGGFRDLKESVQEYGANAEQVLFPYPRKLELGQSVVPDDTSGQLLMMVFSRERLAQVAAQSPAHGP